MDLNRGRLGWTGVACAVLLAVTGCVESHRVVVSDAYLR